MASRKRLFGGKGSRLTSAKILTPVNMSSVKAGRYPTRSASASRKKG